MPLDSLTRARDALAARRSDALLALGLLGLSQSDGRLARDARRHWAGPPDDRWRNDSHWRDGSRFAGTGRWEDLGPKHLDLFLRMSRTVADAPAVSRVVEWGCGGGANAVAFAAEADEFVGVDVSEASLAECARQVSRVCPTPVVSVLADVERPEEAAARVPRPCQLFLCLYVLELVPTPAYGLRLMRLAHDLLEPGGLAFVQIKYATSSWRTAPRRRAYRAAVAGTTYRLDEFWTAMQEMGFQPQTMTLEPANDLDERYAYLLLSKRAA